MAELLLELFSEEIPARMQQRARADLARLLGEGLEKAGLAFKSLRSFATPRRLVAVVDGLPPRSPDVREERKGPRVDAPEAALQGFLKSAGLKSVAQAERRADKKGDFYVAVVEKKGRPTAEVVAGIVPEIVRGFPWPKSMRWGAGKLRWVRPLHSILCLLDGKVVKFEIEGIASGNTTRGHRFMAPKPFAAKGFKDYAQRLRKAFVMLDGDERAALILKKARALAGKKGLALVEDESLLAENAGLTEWPVVLMGTFDQDFLDVPQEVLTTSMKAHQKCFSLRDSDGALANKFILVANLEAKDGGKEIVAGNERVIRARLADAKFFFEQDRKVPLEERVPKLKEIVFHEKLGTQYERVQRLWKLAREIAPLVGAEPDLAERAAVLAKADLTSEMVGEFPELQGVMGRYYALDQKEMPVVADAIGAHYKPLGPSDDVPREPTAIAAALAEKLDTLVGFWAIDEKPTGSKDPYALRRAALGVIRIVLENGLRFPLDEPLRNAWIKHIAGRSGKKWGYQVVGESPGGKYLLRPLSDKSLGVECACLARDEKTDINDHIPVYFVDAQFGVDDDDAVYDLFGEMEFSSDEMERLEVLLPVHGAFQHLPSFFAHRLKIHLRDQGARHDLVDAVFALGGDDLLMIVRRVEALGKFLETEDGANLLTGTKRAINILRIEEKKDSKTYDQPPDPALLQQAEEKALAKAVDQVEQDAATAIAKEDFEGAMAAMAKLRAPVDAFFDNVTVNADDKALRENRLRLLNRIRATTLTVADFSKIEG